MIAFYIIRPYILYKIDSYASKYEVKVKIFKLVTHLSFLFSPIRLIQWLN